MAHCKIAERSNLIDLFSCTLKMIGVELKNRKEPIYAGTNWFLFVGGYSGAINFFKISIALLAIIVPGPNTKLTPA